MGYLDKFSLSGKKIIVTGGAQGIGKTVCAALADGGAEIGIFDLQTELANDTADMLSKKYNAKVKSYHCDVTDEKKVEKAFQDFLHDFGTLDGLLNNAGIAQHQAAEEQCFSEWKNIVNVNLNGVFLMAKMAAAVFIREGKKGSIVNTSSMSGQIVNIPQKQAAYNSSKAAVTHLTKSLAVEWAEYGIRVNCISPGYILTEMTEKSDKEVSDFWINLIPFKRMGKPEELVGGVIYLLSEASTYTSGTDLVMDGCYTCI